MPTETPLLKEAISKANAHLKLLVFYRLATNDENVFEPCKSALASERLLLLPVPEKSPATRVQVVVGKSTSSCNGEEMAIWAKAGVLRKTQDVSNSLPAIYTLYSKW